MVDLCRSVSISSLIVKCSFFKENNTIKKGGAGVRDMKKKKKVKQILILYLICTGTSQ